MLKLMYITNDPEIAKIAELSGVDRIFVDLEYKGKEERQKNMDTVKSKHSEDDIVKISKVLTKSKLLVRINPINDDSKREIDSVIENGADIIMLPMFKTVEEIKCFFKLVNKRVKTVLLLEHIDAVNNLDEILNIEGIDEIHIGLNDLHLSMNLKFMFELLSNGTVEDIASKINKKNIPFGIGGIGRIGGGMVPAEMIIAEHYRLGSTGAILSRSFCNINECKDISEIELAFKTGVEDIKKLQVELLDCEGTFFADNHIKLKNAVNEIVSSM